MLSKQYNLLLDWEPPSKEENVEYLMAIKEGRDQETAWNFALLNARFVASVIAHSFPNTSISDEMFSDGLLGFFNAVIRVKDINTFFGYADEYIRGYVRRGFHNRIGRKRRNEKWDNGPLSYDHIFRDVHGTDHKCLKQYYDVTACLPSEKVIVDDNTKEARFIVRKIMNESGLSKKEKEAFAGFVKCKTIKAGLKVGEELGISKQALWVRKSRMLNKIYRFVRNNEELKKRVKELVAK